MAVTEEARVFLVTELFLDGQYGCQHKRSVTHRNSTRPRALIFHHGENKEHALVLEEPLPIAHEVEVKVQAWLNAVHADYEDVFDTLRALVDTHEGITE